MLAVHGQRSTVTGERLELDTRGNIKSIRSPRYLHSLSLQLCEGSYDVRLYM